jgi:TorA maturation chaperone TorD
MLELFEINRGRKIIYEFLSKSYYDVPDSNYLNNFISLFDVIENIFSNVDSNDLVKSMLILKNFNNDIVNNKRCKKLLLEDLSKEYTRLFYLGNISVSLYESVHMSPDKLMKSEVWEIVKQLYIDNMFFPICYDNTIEDHISMELLFMSFLSNRAIKDCENSLLVDIKKVYLKQKDFLEHHLLKWVQNFSKMIFSITSDNSFYAGITYFLIGYLNEDYTFINDYLSNGNIFEHVN